jgi:hypothetical protein
MRDFANWCALNRVSELPAEPADVARFVTHCAALGIDRLWPIVQEIGRAHYVLNLADPTLGGPVAAAIKDIAKLTAPRSWRKDEQVRFYMMPYDLQLVVLRRETERDQAVKKAQSEAGALKEAIKQTTKVTHGNNSHASA